MIIDSDMPLPLSIDDEAIVLKVLTDANGDPDLMVWTNVATPQDALIMLHTGLGVILANIIGVAHD